MNKALASYAVAVLLTFLAVCGGNGAVPAAAEPARAAPANSSSNANVNANVNANADSRAHADAMSLPLEWVSGRVLVTARVNDSRPARLMLDTGYSVDMVSAELAGALELKRTGRITIVGIAGEEGADRFEGVTFNMGAASYRPRRVAALPASYQRHWRRRDGVLGAGFFRRFVVELDPKAGVVRLYDPETFQYSGSGEVLPFRFEQTTPIVEGAILRPEQAPVEGRFEIDTGCDGGLCLGSDFVQSNHLVDGLDRTEGSSRQGVGGDTRTRLGRVPRLRLGNQVIDRPLTNFFLEGSPVDPGLAGHIGMEVFRRFKVILDYSRKRMILEPAE